ncbi:hypothetical protein M413DRAFT_71424 [Hebeloma cylindrosporum]|uniref:Uncharacterized protein n=1 Tax=Hebeloma cylindrosporum TaxID=76867 RepID=A0A0C2XWE7_HEBCY|nr:hypothetical protein M413DRAFT_71424 [Hebeloma cylindrosporum h7]
MAANASNKAISLLDALDQSFALPASPSSALPLEQSERSGTPLQRNLLQTPNLKHYFESGTSSSSKVRTLNDLRAAQKVQDSQRSDQDDDVADLLVNGLPSGPLKTAGPGGFRLNYDKETPLRQIDLGGPDQQQRIAEFVTKSIEGTSHHLSVREAMQKLGLKDNRDLLPGLEVRLLNHQAIGVAWLVMLEKERGQDRGGILADDMGLGKTVQMIATMAMNLPAHDDQSRTTLVVVPAALLQQWKDEIDTKTNNLFIVHVHHGKDKLKKLSEIKSKDVIVTSYQTFCQDFNVPAGTPPEEEAEWIEDNGGILSKARFYRVIADEAQFIRNRATRSSISLALVKAKYRWMLTGTPVTNTLADIYGLLRFGRFRPWNDWNDFNEHVAKMQYKDALLAGSRAQAILKPLLLRRPKYSTLEGKPLLQLPAKHIDIIKLQFTDEERQLYNVIEGRAKVQLNKFMRNGTLIKNHAFVLVMILRLRQVCCHPYLTLSLSEDFEDPSMVVGTKSDKELSRARKAMGAAWVNDITRRYLLRAALTPSDFDDESDEPAATCPNCKDLFMNDSGRILACGHEICFDCTLDLSNSPIAHNGIFGEGSEKENLAVEREFEAAVAKGYRPCPTCQKMMDLRSPEKVFKISAFMPSAEEIDDYIRSKRRANSSRQGIVKKEKARSPSPALSIPDELSDSDEEFPEVSQMFIKKPKVEAKQEQDVKMIDLTSAPKKSSNKYMKRKVIEDSDSDLEFVDEGTSQGKRRKSAGGVSSPVEGSSKGKGRAVDTAPSDAVIATWNRGDDDLEPSTKMLALLDYLKEWDVSGDKTICYSQWTSMLDLIETLLSRHGIRTLRFDGKMDRQSRDATLATFKQPGGPKVILISTKCGSVGLNLVSANRIVNMDLSWNYAAEAQAYDRCHRIGQEKEVHVKRLVVEDTIEDRMLQLQDVKTGLAEAALGEGTGAKLHKLSVKDIKYVSRSRSPRPPR